MAVDFLMIQSCGWVIIDGLVYLTKADASLFFPPRHVDGIFRVCFFTKS